MSSINFKESKKNIDELKRCIPVERKIICKHEMGREAFAISAKESSFGNNILLKKHKILLSEERQALKKLDGARHVLKSLLQRHEIQEKSNMRIKCVEEQIEHIEIDLKNIAQRKELYETRITSIKKIAKSVDM